MNPELLANITIIVILYFVLGMVYRRIILAPVRLSIEFRMKQLADELHRIGQELKQFQATCDAMRTQMKLEAAQTSSISLRMVLAAFLLNYRGTSDVLALDNEMRQMCDRSEDFKRIYVERLALVGKCLKYNMPVLCFSMNVFGRIFRFQQNTTYDYFYGAVRLMYIAQNIPTKPSTGSVGRIDD